MLRNGEEHVLGLHLRGEVLATDGSFGHRPAFDVIALEPGGVCLADERGLADHLLATPSIARCLLGLLARRIGDDLELQLLMASYRADERVARFLLHLRKRLGVAGLASDRFWLPLTRKDLASLLGLRVPTVSRVFSTLRDAGVLTAEGHRVTVLDRSALAHAAGFPTLEDAFTDEFEQTAAAALTPALRHPGGAEARSSR